MKLKRASTNIFRKGMTLLWFLASLSVGIGIGSPSAEAQPFAYVTNYAASPSPGVWVIDTATNAVVATVAWVPHAEGVAITPDGTRAYVTHGTGVLVSVIDTATNTVVASVVVGLLPRSVAITPDGTRAYVVNRISSDVSVIDTATNTVIGTVEVGLSPMWVAISPDGTRAYVTNTFSNSVSVIDTGTNTVVAAVAVGGQPFGMATTPDGSRAYVANQLSDNVSVINTATNTVVGNIPVEDVPTGVTVSPNGARAYVTNQWSGTVSVIDTATNTVVASVAVGIWPVGVAVTPDGTRAYVTNLGSGTVSVIDTATNTVVDTVLVGDAPFGVAITPPPPDGVVGAEGGTVADTAGSGATFSLGPGVLPGQTNVFIDVIADPGVAPPPGFVGPATLFVNFTLVPNPSPLPAPGATITLPLAFLLPPGLSLPLFKFEPPGTLIATGIVGTVDPGGATATFSGVTEFSVFVGFQAATVTVGIDIHPGSFPNSVNPRSKGLIPVAILATDSFDATTVDPTTVLFGATGTEAAPLHSALEDVDGDGDTDMILHFNTQTTGIQCGDTSASLTGKTFDGQMIKGSDSIRTVGCK